MRKSAPAFKYLNGVVNPIDFARFAVRFGRTR